MFEPFKFEERGLGRTYPGKVFTKDESRGEKVRSHYHHSLEFNIFHTVRGTVRTGGREFLLEDTSLLILPPLLVHGYVIEPGGSITVGHISPALLDHLIDARSVGAFLARRAGPLFFSRLPASAPPREEGMLPPFRAAALLFSLLELMENGSGPGGPAGVPSGLPEARVLKQVIDLVEREYPRNISLEEAAGITGMSRSRFCALFKRATGESFHRFHVKVRLENGARMIGEGASVTEAAAECGFFDASHFIRFFYDYFGHTPGKTGGKP